MTRSVETLTSSPGSNGSSGTKLAPSPSECGSRGPSWRPLLPPDTSISPSRSGGRPRREISVEGDAQRPPGTGETVTGSGGSAAPSSVPSVSTSTTATAATSKPASAARSVLRAVTDRILRPDSPDVARSGGEPVPLLLAADQG